MAGIHKFPIVGLGASAGGIEALEAFLSGLPANPGLALVIVTHLPPFRESLLNEIVARYTAMPVHLASDGMKIEINSVYVLPSDLILTIAGGSIHLRPNPSTRERRLIDVFFGSLATECGEYCAGVILSGSDSDGTLGIKAIKERGGLTLAQTKNGHGPAYAEMPESAMATGLVDFAIPAEEMGKKLIEFARSDLFREADATAEAIGEDGVFIRDVQGPLSDVLREQVGHDFSGYKPKTFMRRVQRRMHVTQTETFEAYIERLRQDRQEVNFLFRDLLINVTDFFRDAEAFESLQKLVIPKIFEGKGAADNVRVWVPGCSTGEEVYSIAILLLEYMDQLKSLPLVQVFATDIDERSLTIARAGRYPAALLENVSEERRAHFFVKDGETFVVSKQVRDLCIFSPHSVIRDPPFSRMDLISCRNLLIYFGADLQKQVAPIFQYALLRNGFLFLGTAENVGHSNDMFVPLDKKNRIFQRRPGASGTIRLPAVMNYPRPGTFPDVAAARLPTNAVALREAVSEQVLERHAPPHVVVNRTGDVVYFSPRIGKYLEVPPGTPTRQLLTLARKGLRLDLREILKEAIDTGRSVDRRNISIEDEGAGIQTVAISVEPLIGLRDGEELFLIVFDEQGMVLSPEEAGEQARAKRDDLATQLERELRDTRDRLQSNIEEYETALEELKSSNEELMSVNEEMQSTNEELESSKEELQSVNEELHTVNSELNNKVEALDIANSDLLNLFDSTDVATIFLDRNLKIRSFTPAVASVYNILPNDRGRAITDLTSPLVLDRFLEDLKRVLAEHIPLERHVDDQSGNAHYIVRIAPYRDEEKRPEGVVVTFVDVTNLTQQARQRVIIAELQHRTRNLLSVIQSVAKQTIGRGAPLESFFDRLEALGRVQGLFGGALEERVDLSEIVKLELHALGVSIDGKATIEGPSIELGFEMVQTLSLALHELATNAMKYGAFRVESGRVKISWTVEHKSGDQRVLRLIWQESGVPGVDEPTRSGFGRDLLERALAYTLNARTKMSFGPDGVCYQIEVPIVDRSPSLHTQDETS